MDVFAGLDVGYRDPTAFCVLAYDWDENCTMYLMSTWMLNEQRNNMLSKYKAYGKMGY